MRIDANRFLAKFKDDQLGSEPHDAQCEPAAATTDVAPRAEELNNKSVLGAKLETVTAKSLIKADEILDLPLDPEREHYQAELRARASIINTTLNTQARVGEAALHKETWDRLPEIIKLIQEEEKRLYGSEAETPPKTADELKQDADEELHLRKVVQQTRASKQDDG